MNRLTALIPLQTRQAAKDFDLVLVDGYPLAYYVAKACKASGVFDEIYLSAEDEIFREYARQLQVRFHQRKPAGPGDEEAAWRAFAGEISAEFLVELDSTAALIEPATIESFSRHLQAGPAEILFSGEESARPSFDGGKSRPWRVLAEEISSVLLGRRAPFERNPAAEPVLDFHPISRTETLRVRTPDDLYIMEACLNHRKRKASVGRFKFHKDIVEIDSDLVRLIKRDGVDEFTTRQDWNQPHMRLADIKAKMAGSQSWCHPFIYTDNDQCCLIAQAPGEGCRKHFHTNKDEWWLVLEGAFEWRLGDGRVIRAEPGEVVYLEKGTPHEIICVSKEMGIRLAGGGRDMAHVYVRD